MAAQGQAGIQKLLEAEQRAAKIVADARKAKSQKLREAETEAQREVDSFRQKREGAFKTFTSEHQGSTSQHTQKLKVETDQKIAALNQHAAGAREKLVQQLLSYVTSV